MRLFPALFVFISFPVFAYIDPNVGSMILQALVAGVAAAGAAVSIYWSKIKSYFSSKEPEDEDQSGQDDDRSNQDEKK